MHLDVPHAHQLALIDADLTTPVGLQNAIAAAKVLQRAMNAEIRPGIKIQRNDREKYDMSFFRLRKDAWCPRTTTPV